MTDTPHDPGEPGESSRAAAGSAADDESTGLPGLRSWRAVYVFVLACFVADILLLIVLERMFP